MEVRARVAEWLKEHQGAMSRSEYAADITSTGWSIDYSRLGRYMREELPTGKDTLAHLAAYAAARDLEPVDLGPREPQLSLEERAVLAAERQADATEMLVLLMLREELPTAVNGRIDEFLKGVAARGGTPLPAVHPAT